MNTQPNANLIAAAPDLGGVEVPIQWDVWRSRYGFHLETSGKWGVADTTHSQDDRVSARLQSDVEARLSGVLNRTPDKAKGRFMSGPHRLWTALAR